MPWFAKITCTFAVLLAGCSVAQPSDYNAGNTTGINHTEYSISDFKINGAGGSIGGYTCCVMIPKKWTPELKAYISWKTIDTKGLPPPPNFNKVDDFNKWEQNVKDRTQYHEAIVPIAQYDKSCGLQVHFLPCNKVKVVSSCFTYGMPEYPIQAPKNMKEPAVCPK
ncbi:TPA: DUF3304 domain-containing protein [Proteus mirabilis]|uniref:DUF3304 domain-containing protein n=1 Tax=Proteus mirabilis TaxID=584 RepID=UPI0013D235B7|nr:DUF3304 domain-containing protein [Proteus mirabilis]EKV6231605.1 DUF3304 domain-containing protein [Proteus mirabilis]MBG2849460.1 DUF3304 domain-containing protein [Proteus mirabilis]MBG3007409.1 DUF3304 domain-containing protein [Proteus mirabilis]MBG3085064.1 DUF3304 domain-containing protein [Proteus mirabilis]MBG3088494.1 DUF3304 domain-containing protein [Proteus mirabilis]